MKQRIWVDADKVICVWKVVGRKQVKERKKEA